MGVSISYMGTKRRLASEVGRVVRTLPRGPVLDAFSGMCAVGQNIGPLRQIWTNDIQPFPAMVGMALFCSKREPMPSDNVKQILEGPFRRNLKALEERFITYLTKEEKYLVTRKLNDVMAGNTAMPYVGNDSKLEQERKRLARKPNTFPYRLATITYAGSFFGVKQSMELDSLRYAIDTAEADNRIDAEQRDWFMIALGKVASRINNSTGQFAQYIKPSENNIDIIIRKRRRSAWKEFFSAVDSISPIGTSKWRSRNRAFQTDAIGLLSKIRRYEHRPAIVYADPPYSQAQYSRYYHVLDMLIEYRYPPATGSGRYPDKRYQASFSHSAAVLDSMRELVERASDLGTCLVLSYPENGLFCQKGESILELLKGYYPHVTVAYSERQDHSTFGGVGAPPKVYAVENVYIATR